MKDILSSEWVWRYFSRDEMKCKGNGECRICPDFMDKLEKIREEFGKPIVVTSGYRSPEYNNKVSHTGQSGPHTTGKAVDISIRGEDAYRLLSIALKYGMIGVGVSQKGTSRFLHLDALTKDDGFPRPSIWSY